MIGPLQRRLSEDRATFTGAVNHVCLLTQEPAAATPLTSYCFRRLLTVSSFFRMAAFTLEEDRQKEVDEGHPKQNSMMMMMSQEVNALLCCYQDKKRNLEKCLCLKRPEASECTTPGVTCTAPVFTWDRHMAGDYNTATQWLEV